MFLKVFSSMNLRTLIAHSHSPLGSSTNGLPYQRLPYLEVKDNCVTRIGFVTPSNPHVILIINQSKNVQGATSSIIQKHV